MMAVMAEPFELPERHGARPHTTHPTRDDPHPHSQRSQNAPPEMQEALFDRVRRLEGVVVMDSCVSVPGARAFRLSPDMAAGPQEAFQCQTEFAHLHPPYDGSLHATLPPVVYEEVLRTGWGEPHPISGTMLLFGPRHADELEVVFRLVRCSYEYARGTA